MNKHPLADCANCPLKDSVYVPSDGPEGARVVVVSRSPGYHEAMQGKPFIGPSGKVLDHLLKENGYKREDVLATNVVLCETDKPAKEAIKACSLRLETEINAANTILACGSEAAKELSGITSVHNGRGIVHSRENFAGKEQRVVVTFNPAIAIRDDSHYPSLLKDFKLALNPKPIPTLPEVRWTNDPQEARSWFRAIRSSKLTRFAVDLETTSLDFQSDIVCVGVSGTGNRGIVFSQKTLADIWDDLKEFLENSNYEFVWHNGKFDVKNLRHKGIHARVDHDTMLLSMALDERKGVHALEYILMDELGWPDYEPDSVKSFKRTGIVEDEGELYQYNGLDTAGTMQLYEVLAERCRRDGTYSVYESIMVPASEALTTVELTGFVYDVEAAADLNENEVLPRLNELRQKMREIIEEPEYNPNSPKQNAILYYKVWKLEHPLNNKKEDGLDKDIRECILEGRFKCAPQWKRMMVQFTEWLHEFKKLDKQRSTYIEGMIENVNPTTGRIYCHFNIGGTEAGRLSSSNPNLQNITRGKEGLPNIRSLFVASPGRVILSADYSQAELRTAAVVSGDRAFQEIYERGMDLHAEVAREFFGADYTYEQRVIAKNINFGVMYLQGAGSFSQMYNMSYDDAQGVIDAFWTRFPRAKEWTQETIRELLSNGYLTSVFGRKRRFWLVTDENKHHVIREGINAMIQGPAADFTTHSVIELVKEFDPKKAQVLVTVHDSIVSDVDENHVDETAKLMKEVMESRPKELLGWTLPFKADLSIGPNWGTLEDLAA